MTVVAVLKVLEVRERVPCPRLLVPQTTRNEAAVTVLTVSAVVAVSV